MNPESPLQKFNQYIPLATVAIITLGYLNLHMKFKYFDIEINNYVDASEIIFSFTPILYEISIVLLCFLVSATLRYYRLKKQLSNTDTANVVHEETKPLTAKDIVFLFIKILLFVGVIIFPFYLSVRSSCEKQDYAKLTGNLFAGIVLLPMFFVYLPVWIKFKVLHKRPLETMLIALVSFFVIFLSVNNYYYYKFTLIKPQYNVALTLSDGKEFKSDSVVHYIGSTKGFYFFRNIKTEKNIIIPSAEAKEIDIQVNH